MSNETWQIGRTVLTEQDASTDSGAVLLSKQGDRLRMSGTYLPPSLEAGRVFAQQMMGYNDGQAIPVVAPEVFDVSGFYIPSAVSVSALKGLTATAGAWEWTANLDRVPNGYVSAEFEVVASSGARPYTGTPTPTTLSSRYGYPTAYAGGVSIGNSGTVVETATGNIVRVSDSPSSSASQRYAIGVDDYYNGAALIEVKINGVWYPAIGDQLMPAQGTRISNGLMRFECDIENSVCYLEWWDGTDWADRGAIEFDGEALTAAGEWTVNPTDQITVLRNTPAAVAVSIPLVFTQDSGPIRDQYGPLVVGLIRSARYVEMSADIFSDSNFILPLIDSEAWSNVASASWSTTYRRNASGYVIVGEDMDPAEGNGAVIPLDAVANWTLGHPSANTDANRSFDVIRPYLGANSSRQRVVV